MSTSIISYSCLPSCLFADGNQPDCTRVVDVWCDLNENKQGQPSSLPMRYLRLTVTALGSV